MTIVLALAAWIAVLSYNDSIAPRRVHLVFIDPQFLPWWKKEEIRYVFNDYHNRLASLGIPMSTDAPAIEGDHLDGPVFQMEWL